MKTIECKTTKERLAKTEQAYDEAMTSKKRAEMLYSKKIGQLRTQLVGALRRINYMVEEKMSAVKYNAHRESYTTKLELEVFKSEGKVKGLGSKIHGLAHQVQSLSFHNSKEKSKSAKKMNNTTMNSSIRTPQRNMQKQVAQTTSHANANGKEDEIEFARKMKEFSIESLKQVEKDLLDAQVSVLCEINE
jgi:hypothetical protein